MNFPAYENIKESGISWVGTIPMHWHCTRLKNLFELMNRVPEANDEIVTSFRDGEVTLRSNRRKDGYTNAIQEHGYQRVLPNDLVIHAMDAFAGAIGVSDSTGKSTPVYSVCSQRDPETDVRYFSRLLRQMALSGYINSLAKGIRERSTEFRWKASANVTVPVPPSAEQKAISSFLDRETSKIDALVAEKRRLIALLKEKRQAVISHAVTKGLNPDVPMKPSGIPWLGDVPEHWPLGKLSFVSSRIGDGLHGTPKYVDESEYRFINGNNLSDGRIVVTDTTRCVSEEEHAKHGVDLGETSLLMSINGTIGNLALYHGELVMLGKSAAYINCIQAKLDREFLYWFLQSGFMRLYFEYNVTGTTIYNLSLEAIRRIPVPLPSMDEQEEVVAYLRERISELSSLVGHAERAIDLLQERRTALISAAVTGKIDVRQHALQESA